MSGDCDVIDSQLGGMSLGERHKSLNQLIEEASPVALSAEAVRGWAHSSQAQQIFLARLADHFRNAAVICELLCSENEMVVSVALHATWFFRGLTDRNLCNAHYFITQIFPRASYHTICRIVSALSVNLQDEAVAEDFYVQISATYGNSMAERLLRVCGIDFIRNKLMEDNFDVSSHQLLYIYKKDQQLVINYLLKYIKQEGVDKLPRNLRNSVRNYKKVWSLIARNHLELYIKLFEQYPNFTKVDLGARLTKAFMKLAHNKVIAESSKYLNILHKPTVFSKLKPDDLEKCFLDLLPAKVKSLNVHSTKIYLKNIKLPFRAKFFMKVYSLKYDGASFLDRDDAHNWDLLEYISGDLRNSWVQKMVENMNSESYSEEFYLKYATVDKAMPRLKTICQSKSDRYSRTVVLRAMVTCCKINDDHNALLELMKYVAKRHRNDQHNLQDYFLEVIKRDFKLYQLSSEHWSVINEMLDFMSAVNKFNIYYDIGSIYEQYIHYCLINNQDIEPTVDKLLELNYQDIIVLYDIPKYGLVVRDMVFSKYKLKLDKECETKKVLDILIQLFKVCSSKNKYESWISKYSWLFDFVKQISAKPDNTDLRSLCLYLYKNPKTRQMFSDLILKYYCDKNTVNIFLKHDASVVLNSIDNFIEKSLKWYSLQTYVRTFHKIRAYFMKPIGECLVEKIRAKQTDDARDEASKVLALSFLLNISKGEEMIKKMVPTRVKVDLKHHAKEYAAGEVIGNNLRHINPPVSYSLLLQFAQGDYLRFTLRSLMHLSFKKSTVDTGKFIIVLSEKPVSVKKHAVRLAYVFLPQSEILQLYKNMWKGEKNGSIRDVIFHLTFNLLKNERNTEKLAEIWSTLKDFMQTFTELDQNSFCYLSKADDISPTLISDYCETCWEVLKSLMSQNLNLSNEISQLINSFSIYMKYLSEEFSELIITEYFNSINNNLSCSESLLSFLVNYIMNATDVELQNKHMKNTCKVFAKYISDNWNKKIDNEFKYRIAVKDFIDKSCSQSIHSKMGIIPVGVISNILEMITSALPFGALFQYYISLNITINYLELLQKPCFSGKPQWNEKITPDSIQLMKEFGNIIGKYFLTLSEKHGTEILPIFVSSYKRFMNYFYNYNQDKDIAKLYLISGLIENKASRPCLILAIELIPSSTPEDSKQVDLYNELLSEIVTRGDLTVRVILDSKIVQSHTIFDVIEAGK